MSKIKIEKPTKEMLQTLDIEQWSPWDCQPSVFDWEYTNTEIAYILDGKVRVKTDEEEVEINAGDLVTFPKGLKCTWNVLETIRKVYTFD
jgi:uncharacterized cupin superfamily protein